jgi:hypothetical protein
MTLYTFVAFLGAAYLLGIATTVMLLTLMLSPVDGIARSGCAFRGLIFACIAVALYLIWLGLSTM